MRSSTVTSATQLGPFRQLHIDPGDVLADWSADIDTGGFGIHHRHVEFGERKAVGGVTFA